MDGFTCTRCCRRFPLHAVIWRCSCGGMLDLVWEAAFPRGPLSGRPMSLWRYHEALPLPAGQRISLGEPFTPLVAATLWNRTVYVKMDHLLPTSSFKDRGAAVLMNWACSAGIPEVVEDSSGNAGAAISAYAAAAGIGCHIYVPATTSPSKIRQIELSGATIHRIDGPRAEAARAAHVHARKVYYASHSWNPLFLHGTKTIAFEIAESLGWKSPDYLVVPTGNGTLLLGAWLGFRQLKAWGYISHLPRLVAVQAASCAPLAWEYARTHGGDDHGESTREGMAGQNSVANAATLAEGIAVTNPVRGSQILSAVRQSGGSFVVVQEAEIAQAYEVSARRGLWMEPTSAAGFAGLRQALGWIPDEATVVAVVTGHGMKGENAGM